MPKIIVKRYFKHSDDGLVVTEYPAGDQPREVSARCAEIAIAEGWAISAEAEAKAKAEADEKAKTEAEAKPKAEADEKPKAEAEGGDKPAKARK